MILQNRNDLFKIELPKTFIPDSIKAKYNPYVFKLPIAVKNISDLINYSIQSITIPNFNYQPVEQVKPGYLDKARGTVRKFRASQSPELLIDRKFSITFQLLDGNINYWILLETLFSYYSFDEKDLYTSNIPLRIFDAEGNLMYSQIFRDCLFTGISEFTMSYSEVTPEFRTFEASFEFNDIQLSFETQ